MSVSSFIGYLKENSSTMINEQLGELRSVSYTHLDVYKRQ